MPTPMVSVIVPVYNGARFLRDAIVSIRRQRYEPLEILVVDDGSTDDTAGIAAGLGREVRYAHQPNAGTPAARNTGLGLARGSLIAFLDADDVWTDRKLAIQVPHLTGERPADVTLGYSRITYLAEAPPPAGPERAGPIFQLGAALVRRSAFDAVGFFDPALRYGDDVDWFLRANEAGLSLKIHPDVVQLYRRHDQNLTNDREVDRRFFVSTLKKSLDRRRRGGGGAAAPLPPWLLPPRS